MDNVLEGISPNVFIVTHSKISVFGVLVYIVIKYIMLHNIVKQIHDFLKWGNK